METNALATPDVQDEVTEVHDINNLQLKMHLTGTVIRTTLAGALIDVGLDIPGVVHISQLQAEPVNRVEDVVKQGQTVDVWVRRVVPNKKRLELTMIEPLPLEWREIKKDMVVKGKVTRLEKFGAFIDIGAERPGLVHISEMTHDYIKDPKEVLHEGDEVEVQIINVDRRKRQIKLSMKALEEPPAQILKRKQKPKVQMPSEEEADEPVPTAMEIALRQAMERSQNQPEENLITSSGKKRSKSNATELERILSRTLQNKVKSK